MRKSIDLLNDYSWMYEQYISFNKSEQQIASELSVARSTVFNYRKRHGIPAHSKGYNVKGKPKPAEQRKKMSKSSYDRWKKTGGMPIEMREKVSKNRKRTGTKCGYPHIYDPEKGYVAEHRQLAEIKIGRPLQKNEHVHHIDGNRSNNSPSNLIVLTNTEHAKLHDIGRKKDKLGRYT